jgi:glucokinase
MRDELSKAERCVADLVLSRPRQVLSMPVKEIAREAKVSEPTVIRLCRTLGCLGLHDFKLRLAAGLASSAALGPQSGGASGADDVLDHGVQALEDTASALLNLRGRLQSDTLRAAIFEIKGASRICLAGLGHYSHLAREFELRLVRLGYRTACFTDEWSLASGMLSLGPGDVLLIMSNTGRVKILLQCVQVARDRGAAVIAVTTAGSPLAKQVDYALVAEHEEDVAQTIPMASRTLHLMLTDVLLIGLEGRYPLKLLDIESNPD